MRSNAILGNIQFVYSLVPNLYVPLDTTSLEVSGILQTQNQPGLQLHGANILLGFVDTGINYTHPAFFNCNRSNTDRGNLGSDTALSRRGRSFRVRDGLYGEQFRKHSGGRIHSHLFRSVTAGTRNLCDWVGGRKRKSAAGIYSGQPMRHRLRW